MRDATKFKHQDNIKPKGSGNHISIKAFKGSQLRIYGALLTRPSGMKVFICSAADIKKKDDADPARLQAAADRLKLFLDSGYTA